MPSPHHAARRIQRAFRKYRAGAPSSPSSARGPLHPSSSSSSSPRIYQDDERLAPKISALLASELVRLARLGPLERDEEVGRALAQRRLVVARGMVRAGRRGGSGIGFTGGRAGQWAVRGYQEALGREPAVADLTPAQVTYVLLMLQREAVPRVAAQVLGHSRPRILRSEVSRKSLSPKLGRREREVAYGEGAEEIVGQPGDGFALRPDMRRFLRHVLGGSLRRYNWRMNPRRRKRRRRGEGGRLKRWVMHSNDGVSPAALYAWLREMYLWSGRMDRRRNWAALYPRPLQAYRGIEGGSKALPATLRDLLRRHVFGLNQHSSIGPFPGVRSRTEPRRQPRSGTRVAGIFGDGRHAGVFLLFVRRASLGLVLQVALLDPLGAVHFPRALESAVQTELRRAASDVGVALAGPAQVAFFAVGRDLAVQYASEGACGPSSIALLLSALRQLRTLPASASPSDAARAAFAKVADEDVVLAAQLHHSSVL